MPSPKGLQSGLRYFLKLIHSKSEHLYFNNGRVYAVPWENINNKTMK